MVTTVDPIFLKKLESHPQLPSPPGVAEQIIELNKQPGTNIDTLAEIIRVDPVLSAKILRYANSPLYRRLNKIETLQQAAALFGWNGMLNLALSFSIACSMKTSETSTLDYNYFWKHSLACAAASRQLGLSKNYKKNDELFLPGLMQNIGMLAIEAVNPDVYDRLENKRGSHLKVQALEIQCLNADHAAIGAWLLEKWHLPVSITQLVKVSHDKIEPEIETELLSAASYTAMADFIADCICCDDEEKNYQQAAEVVNEVLQLDIECFLKILEQTIEEFRESAELFEISTGDITILDAISENAKVALMH